MEISHLLEVPQSIYHFFWFLPPHESFIVESPGFHSSTHAQNSQMIPGLQSATCLLSILSLEFWGPQPTSGIYKLLLAFIRLLVGHKQTHFTQNQKF